MLYAAHLRTKCVKRNSTFWYANGQLHIERDWAYSRTNGRERRWYEDGDVMYDVQNINGEEVEGKFWDTNGTLSD